MCLMLVEVLGSAAGGGFPQWNCNCVQCAAVREGSPRFKARTQSSIAVSQDGAHWLLINASPDIRQQLTNSRHLHPVSGPRHTPLIGVVLTDAQIDHVTGLLMLREGCPLDLFCTPSVYGELTETFPVLSVLEHWNGGFRFHPILEDLSGTIAPSAFSTLQLKPIPLVSNAPPYSPRRNRPKPGDNIGLYIEDTQTGKGLFYAPGLAEITQDIQTCLKRADCVLVDGTFWSNDEMSKVGLGQKLARDMGHLPLSGTAGMIEALEFWAPQARKILIHINNTNPILDEQSPERALLTAKQIEVAYDGMQIRI